MATRAARLSPAERLPGMLRAPRLRGSAGSMPAADSRFPATAFRVASAAFAPRHRATLPESKPGEVIASSRRGPAATAPAMRLNDGRTAKRARARTSSQNAVSGMADDGSSSEANIMPHRLPLVFCARQRNPAAGLPEDADRPVPSLHRDRGRSLRPRPSVSGDRGLAQAPGPAAQPHRVGRGAGNAAWTRQRRMAEPARRLPDAGTGQCGGHAGCAGADGAGRRGCWAW